MHLNHALCRSSRSHHGVIASTGGMRWGRCVMRRAYAVRRWLLWPIRPSMILAASVRDSTIASIFLRMKFEKNAGEPSGTPRIGPPSDDRRRPHIYFVLRIARFSGRREKERVLGRPEILHLRGLEDKYTLRTALGDMPRASLTC